MTALILSFIIFLIYLIYEHIVTDRRRNSISCLIAVTGIRGKTSVVRMLSSVLRENDFCVLAKTTGSQPRYILPDGNEKEIKRKGLTSVIEQKKLLKLVDRYKPDFLIAEIMSIHPENHYVESHRILKPDIVIITNIRKDHTDALGKTEDEIASVLCLDIYDNSTVFIPESEFYPVLIETVKEKNGKLYKVTSNLNDLKSELAGYDFDENICIVNSVTEYLNIKDEIFIKGIKNTRFDIGEFKIWKYKEEKWKRAVYFAGGFAANDPQSTLQLIKKLKSVLPDVSEKITGIITLRQDRGDRTVQWIEALQKGMFSCFEKIYVTGGHSAVFNRKIANSEIIREKSPAKITEILLRNMKENSVVFGFGNISGTGKSLVEHWKNIGEEHGI